MFKAKPRPSLMGQHSRPGMPPGQGSRMVISTHVYKLKIDGSPPGILFARPRKCSHGHAKAHSRIAVRAHRELLKLPQPKPLIAAALA